MNQKYTKLGVWAEPLRKAFKKALITPGYTFKWSTNYIQSNSNGSVNAYVDGLCIFGIDKEHIEVYWEKKSQLSKLAIYLSCFSGIDVDGVIANTPKDTFTKFVHFPEQSVDVPVKTTQKKNDFANEQKKAVGKDQITISFSQKIINEQGAQKEAQAKAQKQQAIAKKARDDYQTTWGMWTDRLAPVAADYYLLLQLRLMGYAEQEFKAHLDKTARLVADYCDMALGGELRHANSYSGIQAKLPKELWEYVPKYSNRMAAWLIWKQYRNKKGLEALKVAETVFSTSGWSRAFGGKAWANIATHLISYLEGEISPELFVDIAFALQHNTGTVFNKHFSDLSQLKEVLDANLYGNRIVLLKTATEHVAILYKGVLKQREKARAELLEIREWVSAT